MNTKSIDIEEQLILITQQLLAELHLTRGSQNISIHDSIQDQLGIDSIGRAELFTRIEKAFEIELPLHAVMKAATLANIVTAVTSYVPVSHTKTEWFPQPLLDNISVDLPRAKTLVDVLIMHATATPNRPHIYLLDEQNKQEIITYQQLLSRAQQVSSLLVQRGMKPKDRVAIMLPTQAEFFYSFMGILLAGGIPVPIYPPTRAHQLEEYIRKEARILVNAGTRFLITFQEVGILSRLLKPFVPCLSDVIIVDDHFGSEHFAESKKIISEDLALIQYTSGSTSHPKGVALTHDNLISNIRAYGEALQLTPSDVCVSWLPLYHDLGLIGNWLGSLYWGVSLVIFSPLLFLTRPERWLWAIHHYQGTISAGPNFAYELCVRKLDPAATEGLNLSSWRVAINGAETVYPKTLERFTEKFTAYGFKAETCLPVYGLAENSLGVTCPPLGRKPLYDNIDRIQFERERRAIPTDVTDIKKSLLFTSCGIPLPGNQIRIVDENNNVVPERSIGHIHFKSPASMQGYYDNPEATRAIYHDGWWESGDLGYIANGELYITGRCKDVIIKTGRNLFSSEIEDLTSEVPGIRRGCVVAFSINDTEKGTDQLIIVAETTQKDLKKIHDLVQEKIITTLDVMPDKIILVAPRVVPKTSSGKLQRSACKTMYLENKLGKKILPPWIQLLKIGAKSFLINTKNIIASMGKIIYTLYVTIIFCATLLPMWVVMLIGSDDVAGWLFKRWLKLLCFVSFCPRQVIGNENLIKHKPVIYVVNHQSYIDAIFLSSMLPEKTRYIVKAELFKVPILKTFLTKLKYIAVNKKDMTKSLEDMELIKNAIKKADPVIIFPEGTFSYAVGLRPFKLGAFKLAAEMNIPICPISLQHTRHILRGNALLFKPHTVTMTVCDPVWAAGNSITDMTTLKNSVRTNILDHCHEPSLDFILSDVSASKSSK